MRGSGLLSAFFPGFLPGLLPGLLAGLLLASCQGGCGERGDAARYHEAASDPDMSVSLAACAELSTSGTRGDCQVMVRHRFDDFSSCEDVEPGLWHEECLFFQAEHFAAGGDHLRALRICEHLSFARECDDHVIGALAFQLAERSVPEVVAAWATVKNETVGGPAEMQLWRSWIRERFLRGLPVVLSECPAKTCTVGAERESELMVKRLIHDEGCPPATPPWGRTGDGEILYTRALRKLCPQSTAPDNF